MSEVDDVREQQERRRMSDQPGIGELGRGLRDLKVDVQKLSLKLDQLPAQFAAEAISRERYEADERTRAVENLSIKKQLNDIDAWKQGAFKRAIAIVTVCALFAGAAATIIAAVLQRGH